jgi:hypothetical protein
MSLHERLRDCEAAPWVIKEIKKIEEERDRFKEALVLIADDHCTKECVALEKLCDPCIAKEVLGGQMNNKMEFNSSYREQELESHIRIQENIISRLKAENDSLKIVLKNLKNSLIEIGIQTDGSLDVIDYLDLDSNQK